MKLKIKRLTIEMDEVATAIFEVLFNEDEREGLKSEYAKNPENFAEDVANGESETLGAYGADLALFLEDVGFEQESSVYYNIFDALWDAVHYATSKLVGLE